MKTTRLALAAILLAGAGIRLPAQDFDAWMQRGGVNPSGPSRQLMLVHGLFSSGSTWNSFALNLYVTGDTAWRLFTPTIYKASSFVQNRDSLLRYMDNMNIQGDVTMVGHSMGGLIARLASRFHPAQGILTIGTPHYGAPLAAALADPGSSPLTWFDGIVGLSAYFALRYLPENGQDWAGPFLSPSDVDRARYDVWNTLDDLTGATLLVFAEVAGRFAALGDLSPNSVAIAGLSSPVSARLEQASSRVSIATSIGDGYLAGPYLLIYNGNRAAARQEGDYLQSRGLTTISDGFMLFAGADIESSQFWDQTRAGFALMDLGMLEASYWLFWNAVVVGGMPNDGIVPTNSMVMPGATTTWFPSTPVLHTEETTLMAEYIRAKLNEMIIH